MSQLRAECIPTPALLNTDPRFIQQACQPLHCSDRYTHMLGERQWQYADWLIQQTDPSAKPLPGYRQELYQAAQKHRSASPESYRDRLMAGPALEAAEREAASWLQLNAERRTAVVV